MIYENLDYTDDFKVCNKLDDYEATSISARGLSDALESAKASLESAKAADREIERRKQKIRIMLEV